LYRYRFGERQAEKLGIGAATLYRKLKQARP
jgi:transcriptional regulator of acetoin/glycerol metabolism